MIDLYQYEKELDKLGYNNIAGCDEAGRGPMAGPLVAAAVILPKNVEIKGINDSKKLTPKMREKLYQEIIEKALEVSYTFIDVDDVDKLNVYQASKKAMIESINKMKTKVDYILTDAMPLDLDIPSQAIIKGDAKSASIAAASIIAKVERDHYMLELDKKYPMYGFKKHKGYVTKMHLEAINKYGVNEHYRKSFAPVQEILNKNH